MRTGWVLAGALAVVAIPASALACTIEKVSGTWVVQITRISSDTQAGIYGELDRGICAFIISKNSRTVGNLRIVCPGGGFFSLGQTDFPFDPHHQLVLQPGGKTIILGTQRVRAPNRCEWKIVDRNGLDTEYTVYVSPDMQTLLGSGEGFLDEHYGRTEPFDLTFQGIRQ